MAGTRTLPAVLLPLAIVLASVPRPAAAQDVGERLGAIAVENAQLYVEPVIQGLASALNAGLEDRGSVHGPLGFSFGVRFIGALPPSEAEQFRLVLPESVPFQGETFQDPYTTAGDGLSPTAVGAGAGAVLEPQGEFRQALLDAGRNPEDFNLTLPEGLDLEGVPLAFLEASVGIGFGTEVSGRFLPPIEVDEEVGEARAWGIGVKHSLTRYFPTPTPLIDIALYGSIHSLEVGDYLDASGTAFGAIGHAGLGPLYVYMSGGWNDADVDIEYVVENPDANPVLPADGTRIGFSQGLESNSRIALGAGLRLLLLNLSAEYAFADYDTFSARLSLSFR